MLGSILGYEKPPVSAHCRNVFERCTRASPLSYTESYSIYPKRVHCRVLCQAGVRLLDELHEVAEYACETARSRILLFSRKECQKQILYLPSHCVYTNKKYMLLCSSCFVQIYLFHCFIRRCNSEALSCTPFDRYFYTCTLIL